VIEKEGRKLALNLLRGGDPWEDEEFGGMLVIEYPRHIRLCGECGGRV